MRQNKWWLCLFFGIPQAEMWYVTEVLDVEEILWQRYLVKQLKPQRQGSYVSPIDLHYEATQGKNVFRLARK